MNSIISRLLFSATVVISVLLASSDIVAQRRITPVTPTGPDVKKETPEFDRSRLQEQRDIMGRIVLVDTVTGTEYIDSISVIPAVGNVYPLLHSVTIGVDVWDPAMRLLGQKYGGLGFMGQLSLHNRFFPTLEFGMSKADITPDGMNYTFRSSLAPYFKIGGDYNIFYNSNDAYQFHAGLRFGFSSFSYSIENVTIDNDYWHDTTVFDIPSQRSSVTYWEFVAGVKVKIAGPISLGWMFKYKAILNETKAKYGEPMYVPGFGKKANPISGSFYIMYTLPLNKTTLPTVNN